MPLGNWPDPANQQAVLNLFPSAAIRPASAESSASIGVEGVLALYKRLWSDYQQGSANYERAIEELGLSRAEVAQLQQTNQNIAERIVELQAHVATLQQTNTLLVGQRSNQSASNDSNTEIRGVVPPGVNNGLAVRLEKLALEKALKDHRPAIFLGQMDQPIVMDFIDTVEHFVEMGAGEGGTMDDRCIDVVIHHTGRIVHEWLKSTWALRYADRKIPGNCTFSCPWRDFKTAFLACFVTSASRTTVRTEFANLRCIGDPQVFNERCGKLIRMITNGSKPTEIGRDDPLFLQYIQKLPVRLSEGILHAAQMRNDLVVATMGFNSSMASNIQPYTLADAMLSFEEQRAIAIAHSTSFSTSSLAASSSATSSTYAPHPTAAHPDAMDLSVLQRSQVSADVCFRCRGTGHQARVCPTADPRPTDRRFSESERNRGNFRESRPGRAEDRRRAFGTAERSRFGNRRGGNSWRQRPNIMFLDEDSSEVGYRGAGGMAESSLWEAGREGEHLRRDGDGGGEQARFSGAVGEDRPGAVSRSEQQVSGKERWQK